MASDPSGRVAQLATVCPAVVTLASRGPADEVLARVIEGESLTEVVRATLRICLREPATPAAFAWLACAPASVSAHLLPEVPLRVVRSEIPRDPDERHTWYLVMSDAHGVLRSAPGTIPRIANALADYVSKHAVQLHGLVSPAQRRAWLQKALTYCEVNKIAPGRKHELTTFVGSVHAYREELERARSGARASVRLPMGPIPAPRGRRWRGQSTADLASLGREGSEMRHCVPTYEHDVLAGRVAFYGLHFDDERLTLGLMRRDGRWRIQDLRWQRNAAPSLEAALAVRAWLKRRGVLVGDWVRSLGATEDCDIPF